MFSHQYQACVEGAQKDRLIETVLLSTYSRCFWMRIKNGENGFPTLTEKLSHCEYLANMLRIIGELLCSQ